MELDTTISEQIMAVLFEEGGPLKVGEIAIRVGRSQSAINKRLTELQKEGRIEFMGRRLGWTAKIPQPVGSVRKKPRI